MGEAGSRPRGFVRLHLKVVVHPGLSSSPEAISREKGTSRGEVLRPRSASPPSPDQQVAPLGLKGPRLEDRQVLGQVHVSLPPVLLWLLFHTYTHLACMDPLTRIPTQVSHRWVWKSVPTVAAFSEQAAPGMKELGGGGEVPLLLLGPECGLSSEDSSGGSHTRVQEPWRRMAAIGSLSTSVSSRRGQRALGSHRRQPK